MEREEPFNLSEFLTDSLCLPANAACQTRVMFPYKLRNPYQDLKNQDPLDVLGETCFGQPKEVPEDELGTPVQEFFRGKNVFITGGTGFIGKVLTEKLVRSMPHLGQIYLLIRTKRGKTSKERFEQLLEDRVFLRMKTEVPHYHSKISVVSGDMSKPGLGLSEGDRYLLTDKIHVMFHSAADVRFIEPLRTSIASNVLGCREVLDLAKETTNLQAFVHVSTAYSFCVNRVVEERVMAMSLSYKDILHIVNSKTDQELVDELPRILQEYPNTYTFSKAVCENMVYEEGRNLPICIFRPSVVGPTYSEPVRGWTDNVYGPLGVLLGAMLGILHIFYVNKELGLDVVPVDYAVNCMIAAAWASATNRDCGQPSVYNFTSTPGNTNTWKAVDEACTRDIMLWPSSYTLWYQSFMLTTSRRLDIFLNLVLHKVPGVVLDKLTEWFGYKPRLTKIYQRIEVVKDKMAYFIFTVWEFKNDNVAHLRSLLSEEDKKQFNFDVRDIDLLKYILIGRLGLRYYYLKDGMETMAAAQKRLRWMYWAHVTLKLVSGLVALKLMVCLAHIIPI